MLNRTQIHAQLLQAAHKATGLRAEYLIWAARIIERRIKAKGLLKCNVEQDKQMKLPYI